MKKPLKAATILVVFESPTPKEKHDWYFSHNLLEYTRKSHLVTEQVYINQL